MKSVIWPMLSNTLEKCQLWIQPTEKSRSNPSKAPAKVRWVKTETCTPLKRNPATKLSATMDIANKWDARTENAKKEKSMPLINKTLQSSNQIDQVTHVLQIHKDNLIQLERNKVIIEMWWRRWWKKWWTQIDKDKDSPCRVETDKDNHSLCKEVEMVLCKEVKMVNHKL